MASAIRFCTATDGTKIAYARDGTGPALVRTAFYLNHLEYDWQCAVWKPYLQALTHRHTLIGTTFVASASRTATPRTCRSNPG
jgi:hypothetical protein